MAALDQWSAILDADIESIVATLTGRTEEAEDLRQNAPFAGVLSQEQRAQGLAAFRRDWERRHLNANPAVEESSLTR